MINGVLLLVFPRPDAQTLGTWLTPCFHLPSGNQGQFAWTAQVYDFGYLWVVWGFRTVQIPLAGRHWYSRAQHSRINCENSGQEITSKTNTEPPKCHWLPATGFQRVQNPNPNKIHNASKSCSRQTTICKKHGFSKFDRTWVRKKTHQNEPAETGFSMVFLIATDWVYCLCIGSRLISMDGATEISIRNLKWVDDTTQEFVSGTFRSVNSKSAYRPNTWSRPILAAVHTNVTKKPSAGLGGQF